MLWSVVCTERQGQTYMFSENVEHIFSDAKGMKTIFVCGDLNIDLLKHESHKSTRNFLDMMYSLDLYPLIDKPTRITDSSATLIDNIFTNELHHYITSGMICNDISDHLPMFALCEFNVTRRIVNGFQYVRTVNVDTFASLSSALGQQSWENVVNTNDANQAYDTFLNTFTTIFKKHCPVEKSLYKTLH